MIDLKRMNAGKQLIKETTLKTGSRQKRLTRTQHLSIYQQIHKSKRRTQV